MGTFPPQGSLCLSGVSSWFPKRRGPAVSLGDECFAPVLLLRILILRRLDTTTSAAGNTGWKSKDTSLLIKYAIIMKSKQKQRCFQKKKKNQCLSEFTFIIRGEGKSGHCLQAVGAAYHQRTGAPLRLGGAGGGPWAKATVKDRLDRHFNW